MKVLALHFLSFSLFGSILSNVFRKVFDFTSRLFRYKNTSNDLSPPTSTSTSVSTLENSISATHFLEKSKVYNCESTWAIQNFRLLHGGYLITDGTFSPNDIKYDWFLKLYNGKGNSWHGSSLDLALEPSEEAFKEFGETSGEVEFALIDIDGEKRYAKTKPFSIESATTDCEVRFDEFIKQTDLFDACNARSLLPGGTLTIYSQVSFIVTGEVETIVENGYSRYFNNEESSDLEIKLPRKEYPAHKFVLAARSPVFKEMFERDAVENQHRRSTIVIEDIDEEVFLEMLRFIYTDKVEKEKLKGTNFKFDLLLAADKYNIEELKIICEKEIVEYMSKSYYTATKTHILSRMHNLRKLETKAAIYLAESGDYDEHTFGEISLLGIRTSSEYFKTHAFHLVIFANKFKKEGLKKLCQVGIAEMLSNETAVEILLFSEKHDLECLKAKSIEYVKENVEQVMESDRWNDLASHPLMADLVKDQ